MPNEVKTTVQGGETLSLYGRLYDVSAKDIKVANNLKGDVIREGQKINIPIGKASKKTDLEEDFTKLTYLGEKMKSWDMEIKAKKALLLNENLTPEEREKLEQECIDLINKNDKRKAAADVSLTEDKNRVLIRMKQGMSASELRGLYNLKKGALRGFLEAHNRIRFRTNVGFDYENAGISEGDLIDIPVRQYNYQGLLAETIHSIGLSD